MSEGGVIIVPPGRGEEVGDALLRIALHQSIALLGAEHGKAAASWVFDGNTLDTTYRQFLDWHESGDPLIEEFGHGGWLTGEWADEPTPASLAADLGVDELDEEALTAYEEAAEAAYWAALETTARKALG